MARILPERTVEAWATAYIVRWFPTALLWAPTQGDPLNWDASIALPNSRYFVFEYKAVEEAVPYPFVELDIAQLKLYKDLNDAVGGDGRLVPAAVLGGADSPRHIPPR